MIVKWEYIPRRPAIAGLFNSQKENPTIGQFRAAQHPLCVLAVDCPLNTEDKLTNELDFAVRSTLGQMKIRPNPRTFSSTAVLDWLKQTHNIEATVNGGVLELRQGETLISPAAALRKFSDQPEHLELFVSEGDNHKLWDAQRKQEFIGKHGLQAWEQKIAQKPLAPNVDVANSDISKAEYLSMSPAEKTAWIAKHGLSAQAIVLAKRK